MNKMKMKPTAALRKGRLNDIKDSLWMLFSYQTLFKLLACIWLAFGLHLACIWLAFGFPQEKWDGDKIDRGRIANVAIGLQSWDTAKGMSVVAVNVKPAR